MKNLINLLLFSVVFHTAHAQRIQLVKDIFPGKNSSDLIPLAAMGNGDILIFAKDPTNGNQIWRSDGTANGTYIIKPLNPGFPNAMTTISVYANGKLYYSIDDGTHGTELWVTDGTANGTMLIKDINPGPGIGVPNLHSIIFFNNKVYFAAQSSLNDTELWSSDGTAQGTQLVKDICVPPMPGLPGDSYPNNFKILNGKLIFSAYTPDHGVELWITDGTTNGTVLVSDLNPGNNDGVSSQFKNSIVYKGKLYFQGKSLQSSSGLYTTDGTTTTLLKNVHAPQDFVISNNILYFKSSGVDPINNMQGWELWKTDGTTQGTVLVKDIDPVSTKSSNPDLLTSLNNKLLFKADDGIHGIELWISDGTANGTFMVKDINQGSASGLYIMNSNKLHEEGRLGDMTIYDNIYYFGADDGKNGRELWRTDGTANGTYIVEQVGVTPNNSASSRLRDVFVDNSNVWLSMGDSATVGGQELYLYKAWPQSISSKENAQAGINIYPNPTTSNFTVEIELNSFHAGFLQVFDMTGKEVYNQSIAGNERQLSISLGDVPAGVYNVKASFGKYIATQSVTIE